MKNINEIKNNPKKEYAKRYLLKYINELKVHFDLNENDIKQLMRQIYYAKSPIYHFIKNIKNKIKEKL